MELASTVNHCTWLRKCVFMVWSRTNGPNVDLPLWQNRLSRCWGALLSVVEHGPWVSRYPNRVSQYYVPLPLAQKVCIHGFIQYKWPECWLAFMAKPSFQVLRAILSVVQHVPWVERCPNGDSQYYVPLHVAQKVCIHGLIQYKWPECWLAFMAKASFQVLKSLVVCNRACPMGWKVSKWSQSVLCTTALG